MSRKRRPPRRPIAIVPSDFAELARVPAAARQLPSEPTYVGRRPGRPSMLTPENEQRFLLLIRAGNRLHTAAQAAGPSPRTVEDWIKRGRGRDPSTPADARHRPLRPAVHRGARLCPRPGAEQPRGQDQLDHNAALAWLRSNFPDDWPRLPGGYEEEEPTLGSDRAAAQLGRRAGRREHRAKRRRDRGRGDP